MDTAHVQKMIRQAKGRNSIRWLADLWLVDHSYLYRMMTGEREPSDDVLDILGLERVITYRKRK